MRISLSIKRVSNCRSSSVSRKPILNVTARASLVPSSAEPNDKTTSCGSVAGSGTDDCVRKRAALFLSITCRESAIVHPALPMRKGSLSSVHHADMVAVTERCPWAVSCLRSRRERATRLSKGEPSLRAGRASSAPITPGGIVLHAAILSSTFSQSNQNSSIALVFQVSSYLSRQCCLRSL